MDDQSNNQGQSAQDNFSPFGQPANNNDGALGVNHDQTTSAPPVQQDQPSNNEPTLGPAKGFFDDEDDLLTIKQDALKQLSPLVEHLDQSPEERFRTIMMLIQASDDPTHIKSAYDAAQQIPDEKEKAQALLDVVNEINYFTQAKK